MGGIPLGQVILRGAVPNGYGYGSGDGSGSGYGDGSGSGDGYGSYWRACIAYFAAKWSATQQARLQTLESAGATIAYWRSDKDGRACNGGKNDPVSPGTIEITKGPLSVCHNGTLHATLAPSKWGGERWWIVALKGEIVGDEEKFGALEREIIGEAL